MGCIVFFSSIFLLIGSSGVSDALLKGSLIGFIVAVIGAAILLDSKDDVAPPNEREGGKRGKEG